MTLEQSFRDRVISAAVEFVAADEERPEGNPDRSLARRKLVASVVELQRVESGEKPPLQVIVPLSRVMFALSDIPSEVRILRSPDRTRYWIEIESFVGYEGVITECLDRAVQKTRAQALVPVEVKFLFELIPSSRPDMIEMINADAELCWPPQED